MFVSKQTPALNSNTSHMFAKLSVAKQALYNTDIQHWNINSVLGSTDSWEKCQFLKLNAIQQLAANFVSCLISGSCCGFIRAFIKGNKAVEFESIKY